MRETNKEKRTANANNNKNRIIAFNISSDLKQVSFANPSFYIHIRQIEILNTRTILSVF